MSVSHRPVRMVDTVWTEITGISVYVTSCTPALTVRQSRDRVTRDPAVTTLRVTPALTSEALHVHVRLASQGKWIDREGRGCFLVLV